MKHIVNIDHQLQRTSDIEYVLHTKKEMESFNKEAKPLFSIININNREIRMLNKTASMLLSRLSY